MGIPSAVQPKRTFTPVGGAFDSAPAPTPEPPATPSAPSLFVGDGQLTASWSAVSGATSYDVIYNTSDTTASATAFSGNPVSGTSAVITGLINGTTYYVFVRATNSEGSSAYSASATATPVEPNATLLISENFETGTLGKVSPFGGPTIKAVASNPQAGTYCLRGNLATYFGTNDPITDLPRSGNHTGGLSLATHYPDRRSLNKCFVRMYIRFDDATNLTDGDVVSMPKWCYLSDESSTFETGNAIYPTLEPGVGIRSLARNANNYDYFPLASSGAVYGQCTDCGFDHNGEWNKFELMFDYQAATLQMWCNDIPWINGTHGGEISIDPSFRLDSIRLFHANANVFQNSVNGAGEKGGVQVDSIEIYDGDPR